MISGYKPSWFYFHHTIACLWSCLIHVHSTIPLQRHECKSSSVVGGTVLYDVAFQPELGAKPKVLFIVPGVNGDAKSSHTAAICNKAYSKGYNIFVVNPVAPKDSNHSCLEVIDFTRNLPITEAVAKVKELFGKDAEIYALGFSLGGNHIGRHLGAHENCAEVCGFKAFFSVSAAYDLPSTVASMFSVYNNYIVTHLKQSFVNRRYKVQQDFEPHLCHIT